MEIRFSFPGRATVNTLRGVADLPANRPFLQGLSLTPSPQPPGLRAVIIQHKGLAQRCPLVDLK
jgi:hypothetical protein